MPIGRNCVQHYRQLSRYCVFSHDEMVCNMACKADTMDVDLASAVQKEMTIMVQEEEELRQKINKLVSSFCQKDLSFFISKYLKWRQHDVFSAFRAHNTIETETTEVKFKV